MFSSRATNQEDHLTMTALFKPVIWRTSSPIACIYIVYDKTEI